MREFAAGVQWWRTQTRWPRDFHNADYEVLATANPDGAFSDDWWAGFLPRLTSWVALRPISRVEVTGRLIANRDDLADAWRQVCAPLKDRDIAEVTWEQLRAFPDVVARLKPTRSPVFQSKFCHFLLPRVFPVVDNRAVGGSRDYEGYFNLIKGTWEITSADVQVCLKAKLTRLVVEAGCGTLYSGFPLATKVTELALVGRRRAQNR